MTGRKLVLGLGNELLADDAAGCLVVRKLAESLAARPDVAVVETPEHGLALLDFLVGYEEAVIVDAICTGKRPVGTVVELDAETFGHAAPASPHFAGIPEILALGRRLGLRMPASVRIIAIEARETTTLGGPLSSEVTRAIPRACERVLAMLGESLPADKA